MSRRNIYVLVLLLTAQVVAQAQESNGRLGKPDDSAGVPAASASGVGLRAKNICTDLDGKPESCPQSVRAYLGQSGQTATLTSVPKDLFRTQVSFWSSPARLRERDLVWLLPFATFTAGTMASDTAIEKHLPTSLSAIQHSRSISDYGVAAFAGFSGASFLWGRYTHNDHLTETGLLSSEAIANSFLSSEVLKAAFRRQRPQEGSGKGRFWNAGDSFPSTHSAAAWAAATVIASEYPGPLTKLLAYGGAIAVGATRISGRQHFGSDVLVGSAIGWYMGRQVVRGHGGEDAGSRYGRFKVTGERGPREPKNMGSPYVPLESWVYPAIDRLAALGHVQTDFAGQRPWTRMECARLLEEARSSFDSEETEGTHRIYKDLEIEFASEMSRLNGGRNLEAEIDSVYFRYTGISGTPLTDGFHFGQTIYNDFGRPYQSGSNVSSGISAHATAGPLVFYVRGEYQHAPFANAFSDVVRDAISYQDRVPMPPPTPFNELNRGRLLDTYVALNVSNWEISFGKQSVWWGPGYGGALLLTNNAEPMAMLRVDRVSPFSLPGVLGKWLGPIRAQAMIGRLSGQRFVRNPPYTTLEGSYESYLNPQPYIHGEKFTVRPTENLEVGVGLTAVFAGQGVPLTLKNFSRTLKNYSSGAYNNGDRRTQFYFSYRVPGLRRWLTLYSEGMAEDQPNPIAYPRQSAMNPGIYLSHVPKIPKLDLRVEGVYTDLPNDPRGPFFYRDIRFPASYTNNGTIMGSWVGRQGRGGQASTTYWLSAQKTVQFGYRHADVSKGFIPNGGSLDDFSVRSEWRLKSGLALSGFIQYERWKFLLLDASRQRNVTTAFQIALFPRSSTHVVPTRP